ncbi:MAG: YdcF family protein [Clostridia bacterium]|nr:YdcF family protein [Clostridia bacterium]
MADGGKEGHRKMITVFLSLILIGILCFSGMLIFLCVSETRVPSRADDTAGYDAIIVLGAQVKEDGSPSVQLQWRLNAAAEAWRKHGVPIVVCGAQGADEPEPEAAVMKRVLEETGIPGEMILADAESRNTRENLENARQMLQDMLENPAVLIVSSDYHVPRALALAGDAGLKASGLGSPCKPEYWIKNHFRETLSWVKYLAVKYLRLPL